MPNEIKPFSGILELGLTELVGINEAVAQNQFGGSVDVDVSPGPQPSSGVIHQLAFYQTEDASGAILSMAGTLYVLDADPAVAVADTDLIATEWVTVLGTVDVATTDWKTGVTGQVATPSHDPIWFHAVSTLYFVFRLTSATSINSAGTDDEQLEFNGWYQLYS